MSNASKSTIAVTRELNRLVEKGEIINLRKGFYLIIPPRFMRVRKLPMPLYADKLFKYLDRDYYIGLYSAARIHGAGHQQIQRDYFIIEPPKQNNIRKENIDVQFTTAKIWPQNNIEVKQSDAGTYKVSSPVLTFVDIVHYHSKLGGMNRALAVLEELTEEFEVGDLIQLLGWYKHKSTLQRTGFLLEELHGKSQFSELLLQHIQKQPYYPVLLTPNSDEKPGKANNRWKIDVNQVLESDL